MFICCVCFHSFKLLTNSTFIHIKITYSINSLHYLEIIYNKFITYLLINKLNLISKVNSVKALRAKRKKGDFPQLKVVPTTGLLGLQLQYVVLQEHFLF